jgi:hypothetical protein
MGLSPLLAGNDFTAAEVNQLPVVVSQMVTSSVANSNLETAVGTFTIPAGTITAVNQGFQFKVFCTCGETASPTLTIRMRVVSAAGAIIASGANTLSAAGFFQFDGWLLFNAVGAGGTFNSLVNVVENFTGALASSAQAWDATSATAWNTTISNPIYVTAQFSAANAANTATGVVGNLYQV